MATPFHSKVKRGGGRAWRRGGEHYRLTATRLDSYIYEAELELDIRTRKLFVLPPPHSCPKEETEEAIMSPSGEINGENVANDAQNDAQAGSTHAIFNGNQQKDGPDQVSRQQPGQKKKEPSFIASLLQLRTASKRPLPTERGDGTYRYILTRPGLVRDLRTIGLGGAFQMFDVLIPCPIGLLNMTQT